jgi:hypothetical protein
MFASFDVLDIKYVYTRLSLDSLMSRLCFLLQLLLLRLPASVASASLLDEVAFKPVQCYWLKGAIKSWSLAVPSSHTLMRTVECLALMATTPVSWAARLRGF